MYLKYRRTVENYYILTINTLLKVIANMVVYILDVFYVVQYNKMSKSCGLYENIEKRCRSVMLLLKKKVESFIYFIFSVF